MRLLVVMNPSARDFNAQKRWPGMERLLRTRAEVELLETEPDDQKTLDRIRTAVARGFDRVLAIGGDGTIHLTVNGMVAAQPARMPQFAVIPFGTSNNVAKSLNLPLDDLDRLADIASGSRLQSLDYARLQLDAQEPGLIWLNCVGVGIDADVVATRGNYRKLGGYLGYAAALAERSLEQRSLDAQLLVDGKGVRTRVFNLIITNVPVYAGTLELPGIQDDGLLDVHLLDRLEYGSKVLSFAIKKADVLGLGISEMAEALTNNQRTLRGRRIEIRLAWPHRVQVDGEALPEARTLLCEILGSLQVAAP